MLSCTYNEINVESGEKLTTPVGVRLECMKVAEKDGIGMIEDVGVSVGFCVGLITTGGKVGEGLMDRLRIRQACRNKINGCKMKKLDWGFINIYVERMR